MSIEILEKLDILKSTIDNSSLMLELEDIKSKIFSDKNLLNKIEEYKVTRNSKIRDEIYQDENYKKFKSLENEVYFLTLQINQKLNTLTEGKVCQSENH